MDETIEALYQHLTTHTKNPQIKINRTWTRDLLPQIEIRISAIGNRTASINGIECPIRETSGLQIKINSRGIWVNKQDKTAISVVEYHPAEYYKIEWTDPHLIEKIKQAITNKHHAFCQHHNIIQTNE